LAVSACIVIAAALGARVKPWELLRGSRALVMLALFIILLGSLKSGVAGEDLSFMGLTLPALSADGFIEGLRQGLCIVVSFAAGSLLFSVTTMQELRDSLARFETGAADIIRFIFRKKKKRRHISRIALSISLMLGFLPRFFEIWETANLACDARAGKKGLTRVISLVPLLTERMIETAAETAEALEARGLLS
jgi:biotin transport system permease protein